jgi:transcriptional regulator with XRE-family HTH domain
MKERRRKKVMNIIGPQLRRIRYQQGLTQPALTRKCQLIGWDISRESLAKVESQLRGVSDIEILTLAKALRVHFSVLFP